MRKKKCKSCGEVFQPERAFQSCCSPKCAISYVREMKEKKERKDLKRRKEALKTKSELLKEAQAAFNAWIRYRDRDAPCISCGRAHKGQYHAGHYKTTAAHPELRFNDDNVHKQCSACNNHLSGNILNYRENLVKKIGIERVEILEGPHEPLKLTHDEIRQIKKKYTLMLREAKRQTAYVLQA
jgi:hypothetical protein